jgi:Ser/Thr protein kinase RdoA (MazF antagonist)
MTRLPRSGHPRPTRWGSGRRAGSGYAAAPGTRIVSAPRRVRAWIAGTLTRLEESLDGERLGRTVVHGDFGPYNLLVRSGLPPVLIDWELARLDWRLVDLATCLPRFAGRRRGFDARAARRVISGYRDQTGIPLAHLRRIPDLLAMLRLQRAIVCWSRTDGDAVQLGAEAHRRVLEAEALLSGTDPICSVVRA